MIHPLVCAVRPYSTRRTGLFHGDDRLSMPAALAGSHDVTTLR
jgi:hypothetical protein